MYNQVININYWNLFGSEYGWAEALSGAGYMGTYCDFISDIREGKTGWILFTWA